ncbi:MAG: hypothetical protein OXH01_06470 [Bacteroidetes bacterium]|nr:hypothetical protein [Bacteroidota bacterium]
MCCWCKTCFCALIALGSGIFSTSAQVLTADDLVRAGITRLSDILELADDWVGSSTEGYHWTIAPLGTSWEASPDWSLFIDGQPINLSALNQQSLNALPLTIVEICEVQLHAHPVVIHGILASGGAIQITRCAPQTGITFAGQLSAGNETGDPGPYRYTNFGGPNVDRTGPTIHSSLAIASENQFVQITGALDEHHATDPRIHPRVLQLYQGEKDARILHRALGFSGRLLGHRISAGTSRVEDLGFLPFMGREIPLDQEISYASASFSRNKFSYSLSGNSTALSTRQNPESVSVEFTQRQLYARTSLRTSRLEYGASAVLADGRFGPNLERDGLSALRLDATFETGPASAFRMKAMSALALDNGILGYEWFTHARHEESGIDLRFLIRRRALASRINFVHWIMRGHGLGGAEFRYQLPSSPKRETLYSADLDWTTGDRIKLHLSGGVRRFTDSVRPFTEFTLDSARTHLQTITSIVPTVGNIARTNLRINYPLTQQFTLKIYGAYAYPWSSMHTFRDAWHHRLQVGVRGEFHPNDRFSLDLRFRYVGASAWHAFERAAEENPEFYAMRLPSTVHLHLTAQKRFWQNRLRISATMRNVLNHPHITHPAGARTRSLFQVTLRYLFGYNSRTTRTHVAGQAH